MKDNILEVRGLKVHFDSPHGLVKAVDGINFDIRRGETFGLVGESGSGKTLTALSIMKLVAAPGRIAGGEVLFNGADILKMSEEEVRGLRGSKIGLVFQEPAASLDPVFTISSQMAEALSAHGRSLNKRRAEEFAVEYLKKVHIPDPVRILRSYPHQLSGGTKQRAMIAMALMNSPELLILDEPTTALDVTVQAGILDLLDEIIEKEKLSILFISHDLGIIARMCARIAVMQKGAIVETGDRNEIFYNPKERYTAMLLESVKVLL
ncbi:MAG: ABC transporter ATP-binding protein [Candidatus Omnitrophica bacterium]|nr:ABC transporter ATP-binding protein [Candidatus Omnitrophota bacterium]